MFQSTISMLRVADARKSGEFYCSLLGFSKSWEFCDEEGCPIFLEVTRDNVSFHLSEHEGDGPMGLQVYVNVADAPALHEEVTSRDVSLHEPLHDAEWGHTVFSIMDPDGNTLRFGSPSVG
jgi:catechol 2,3-dioxygenase-like lactoylglutathione lyase family enzyme